VETLMGAKPKRASEYDSKQVQRIRAACLYVATKLGDLMEDTVIVGGLVPSLLIDQSGTHHDFHVGTADLDVGLAVAIFDDQRYQAMSERLRRARFIQDENAEGNPTRQRLKLDTEATVTVDFLIPPTLPQDKPGKLRNLEGTRLAIPERAQGRLRSLLRSPEFKGGSGGDCSAPGAAPR
jgi:hypothetical protein